jgi:hypothetical protein
MKNQILTKMYFSGIGLCLIAVMAVTVPAQTQKLPISAFLDQLGPFDATTWFDPVSGNEVFFDAYGKRNALFGLGLGTTVDGSVSVTIHNDTQRVVVNLRTDNAFCFGADANGVTVFGYKVREILGGVGPAATGSGLTRYVYAPQPTGPVNFDWPLDNQFTTLSCDGLLRAGSGYPEGTPGFAQTTQTGLYSTGVPGGCPPEKDADCFPAEKVQFKPVGN